MVNTILAIATGVLSLIVIVLIIILYGYITKRKTNEVIAKDLEIQKLKLDEREREFEQEIFNIRESAERERTLLYQQTINELEAIREKHREESLRQVASEVEYEYNRQIALMVQEKDRYVQYLNEELEEDSASFMNSTNTLRFMADKMESEVKDVASRLVSLIETEKILLDEQRQKLHALPLTREDVNDLHLLMEEILPRIRREDVIRKLIWVEYIQKPTTQLVNDIFPEGQSGIYKITNLKNKKSYIGRSVNVRSRIVEHIKSSLGLGSIADQAIHRALREEGLENFMFELLEDCEREQLAEREKYYIKLFQSQEHGYNKNIGG